MNFLVDASPDVGGDLLKLLNRRWLLVALQQFDLGKALHLFDLPCDEAIFSRPCFRNTSLLKVPL